MLGTLSLIRGITYQFPQNVMLQRMNLQEEAYINRATRAFGPSIRETLYTSHLTDGYTRADGIEGMYTDVDLSRQHSLMLDPFKSIFQVSSSTDSNMSDHPLLAPHTLTLNLKYADKVMANLIGTQLNTTQKRYIYIDIDTRCIAMADTAPGILSGYLTESSPWYMPSVLKSWGPDVISASADLKKLVKSIFGMPRLPIEISSELNPYLIVTTAFHSSPIQQNLINDFTARGVTMNIDKYEMQRMYLFNGTDQFVQPQTQYNIAGRDPRIIKKVERYGCQVAGDVDVREAVDRWTVAGLKPDVTSEGTTYLSKPLPYYMARDGCFGYSIPALRRLALTNPDTNSNPAYSLQILIDNEALFTWRLGQPDTNNICHMLAHGIGIFRPDFEVSFVPSKRLINDKKDMYRALYTEANCTWTSSTFNARSYASDAFRQARVTAATGNMAVVNTTPFVLNNYASIGQLPTRYVVTVPIRDEAANGTIFTAITTGFTAETAGTTTDYHPMCYRAYAQVALGTLTTGTSLFQLRSAWEQPVSVCRLWMFKQTTTLTFGPSTAYLRELLPTGTVVGTRI